MAGRGEEERRYGGGHVSVCSFKGKDGLCFGGGSWPVVSDAVVDEAMFSSAGKKS
jgi:hypothetical protein